MPSPCAIFGHIGGAASLGSKAVFVWDTSVCIFDANSRQWNTLQVGKQSTGFAGTSVLGMLVFASKDFVTIFGACAPGFVFNPRSNGCDPCGQGLLTPYSGLLKCQLCSLGKFNGRTAQSRCQACQAGRYNSLLGTSSCTACPSGSFNPLVGSASPIDCQLCGAGA
jgi:hypothetical protein